MPEKKIKLSQICKDNGIILAPYKSSQKMIDLFRPNGMFHGSTGFAVNSGGRKYILFDDSRPEMEVRFTVAHELAHHLLGHLDYRSEESGKYPQDMEVEANLFAVAIITNDILCHYCKEDYSAATLPR